MRTAPNVDLHKLEPTLSTQPHIVSPLINTVGIFGAGGRHDNEHAFGCRELVEELAAEYSFACRVIAWGVLLLCFRYNVDHGVIVNEENFFAGLGKLVQVLDNARLLHAV